MVRLRHILLLAAVLAAAPPAFTQAGTPDTMQALREQLGADKKKLVAAHLGELTPQESAAFWPIYDEYQRELHVLNDRLATTIATYAKAYNANSLTDEQARRLMREAMAVEDDESLLRQAIAQKVVAVLPGRKAVRYLQIESKVRALIKYEIAAEVPLVK